MDEKHLGEERLIGGKNLGEINLMMEMILVVEKFDWMKTFGGGKNLIGWKAFGDGNDLTLGRKTFKGRKNLMVESIWGRKI